MKPLKNSRITKIPALLAALLASFSANAWAQISTLVDCPGKDSGGDQTSRGFYVPNYPGQTLNGVTVYMTTDTAGSWPYQVGLIATENAYDGPLLASHWANATLDGTQKAVTINMGNVPVTPGSTICFKFNINKQPGSPDLFYAVPEFSDPCPLVKQTNGTNPPLSTFRRDGVKVQITGERYLNVAPGWSIQLAIDHAAPGDTVVVGPGIYTEDITLRSEVNVVGAGPGQTILQGTGTGDVVTANGVTNAEFSGFTVRDSGTGTLDSGVRVIASSIVIKGNEITNNTMGIRTKDSNSIICGNRIHSNGNASNGRTDYGIYCEGNDLITNNLVIQNHESGVLSLGTGKSPRVINNTIADNAGRGFHAAWSAPELKNNIIAVNSSQGVFAENDSVVTSTYNCLFDNSPTYSEIRGGVIVSKLGDLLVDPQLDPLSPNDYILTLGSPCIDAGDPAAIYDDLDGSRNDIGATGGPCGSSVTPGAVPNGFLWTSVGTILVSEIDQTNGPKGGLTISRDRPFGGKPWLYGPFGNNVTGISRYAVKIAQWTGNVAPSDGDFDYVDDPLSKTRFNVSGGTVTHERVTLGPLPFFGRPTYQPTLNGGNTYWAHENLRLILNTLGLENGRYSIRMEAWGQAGFPFPSPYLITLSPNHDLILHVNNTRPVVTIDSVSYNGALLDECAIVRLPNDTATLDFVYTANHPEGFLDNYAMVALVGRNRNAGTVVSDNYSNHVAADGTWLGETLSPLPATPLSASQPGLQPWESCAYQFRLTAWARTTNGFGRIYHTSFFHNYYIDVNAGGLYSPDLDGDGDVDGDDLAIFAAAYGSSL